MVKPVSKKVLIACSFECLVLSFVQISVLAAEQTLDQQFKAKVDQAQTAERNHEKWAMNLWSEIADGEIAAGAISDGLEHERHAIQLYSTANIGDYFGPLGYMGGAVVKGLAQQGNAEGAEKLLLSAVDQAKVVAGPKSFVAQAQMGDLYVFYVGQKNYQSASKILDRVLDSDLRTGETPSQSRMHSQPNSTVTYQPHSAVGVLHMILVAVQAVEESEPSFAITAVEKVLKAQEACLTANDERLVETLGALGDAYFQAKKYKEADAYYSRAYKITKRYHPEGTFAVHQCGRNFLDNLKQVGRSAEADRLSNLTLEGMQDLQAQPMTLSPPPF